VGQTRDCKHGASLFDFARQKIVWLKQPGDARTTKLDALGLKPVRVFGYWFDFGDDWFHQVQVERIEQAIPTVTYPRVIKRVGKSPPQYLDE
jgi:hypothetical protein